jgi:hypothetical protein
MHHSEVLIYLERLTVRGNRVIVSTREVEDPARVGIDWERERVEIQGAAQLLEGIGVSAKPHQLHRIQVVTACGVWIQLDGASVVRRGIGPCPGPHLQKAQGDIRLGHVGVELYCPESCRSCFRHRLLYRADPVAAQH